MTVQDQSGTATEAPSHSVVLTDAAVAMAKTLMAREGRDDLKLRLQVGPGGCQGLSYDLQFDDRNFDGDRVRDFDGLQLVIDPASLTRVDGATINYVETIQKAGFEIDNPNETSRCACGESFC